MEAWRSAGFTPVGHLVWQNRCASDSRFLEHTASTHEQAFLLAKSRPPLPAKPLPDVQPWHYTGNELHPNQKSVQIFEPLIETFSYPGVLILDPFCGSGSTAVAAKHTRRHFLAIEKSAEYHAVAADRMMKNKFTS